MIASPWQRSSPAVVVLATGLLVLSGGTASAQSGRPGRSTTPPATSRPATSSGVVVPGYGELPTYSVNVPRGRGSGNDPRYGFIPPSGFNVNNTFTVDRVYDGLYIPGTGVNNGFPTPEPVFGGTYVAGTGVNNGFARPETVFGGGYVPGFGVTGGGFAPGAASPRVQGGTILPGFGVTGGLAAGPANSSQATFGGTYSPGFGVSGGAAGGGPSIGAQSVQGGSYTPGFGVGGGRSNGPR